VVYALCIPAAYVAQGLVTFGTRGRSAAGLAVYTATQIASLATVAAISTRFVTGTFLLDTLVFLATAGTAAAASYVVGDRLAFRPEG